MKPTPGYVLIKPDTIDNKTDSGLYKPESNDEKPDKGTVMAVGHSVDTDAPCKPKDHVVYKKWGTHRITHEGEEVEFVRFEDVLAVL